MAGVAFLALVSLSFLQLSATAAEADPQELVKQVVESAGGEEKLLTLFRFRERVLITATPAAPVAKGEKGNRTSVVQVAGDWWINGAKRDKDNLSSRRFKNYPAS
jgi:hypothetical protein